jgi:orotidine-5'-phosphate decarboxylase
MTPKDRLIVALDRSTRDEVLRLADAVGDVAGMLKLGLQAFVANGPGLVAELRRRGVPLFLDLKLHDIPNTVARAVAEAARLDVDLLTIHASGGGAMVQEAARAVPSGSRLRLLAVTLLTSLDEAGLGEIGFSGGTGETVLRLARLAAANGAGGVVASPHETAALRQEMGSGFVIVTPGIRAAGASPDDQARTMTAREAIRAGATYVVVGRPITDARDPRDAARAIVDEMGG